MNKNKYYYKIKNGFTSASGQIIYREPWLVAANILLKILQPWTKSPLLVNVISSVDVEGNPKFEGYSLKKTECFDGYFKRIKNSITSGIYGEKIYGK